MAQLEDFKEFVIIFKLQKKMFTPPTLVALGTCIYAAATLYMFTAIWAFYCNALIPSPHRTESRQLLLLAKPMPFSQLLNCGFCILHTSLQRIYSLKPQKLNLSRFWLTHLYTVFHSFFFPFKETLPLSLKHFWRDLGILGAVSFCTNLILFNAFSEMILTSHSCSWSLFVMYY